MSRPVYTKQYAESVKPRHKTPEKVELLRHYRRACSSYDCLFPSLGVWLLGGLL